MGHEGQLEGLTPTNKQNVESCIFQLKHLGVQQALLKRVSYVRIASGAPVNAQARGYVSSGLLLFFHALTSSHVPHLFNRQQSGVSFRRLRIRRNTGTGQLASQKRWRLLALNISSTVAVIPKLVSQARIGVKEIREDPGDQFRQQRAPSAHQARPHLPSEKVLPMFSRII